MALRVRMCPHLSQFHQEESGIRRVVEQYFTHLPACDIELVAPGATTYDVKAVHAGTAADGDICHCHGLYFTADYPAEAWEYKANANVINSLRHAKEVTVPSAWVAETLQRDMRLQPHVIGHGIDWANWQAPAENGGYVLWNKNRNADVCDPAPIAPLARAHLDVPFLTTFAPPNAPRNVQTLGVVPHNEMQALVKSAGVYLSTTKETFGIGILEALAAGVPVLGFAHGGNLELVQHGVNGYLAQVGNAEDLANGLVYCREHRAVLSANARELARAWTWERAAEQVAAVYRLAVFEEEPTCAIIIPSFNYADKVRRAIESAINQTYYLLTDIVVVDDGSDDSGATRDVVSEWAQRDKRVRHIRQNNQGVAHARNNGIAAVNTKYVCCLDADDAIAPEFISRCVGPLERDRSLGIAYTGLHYRKPNGEEGDSPWPGQFDFNLQLQRQNQIPTCCVFRRKMWERLGGYSQRFAPAGAGSEDAEFWLRCGAYGWGAVKATEEALFHYSWLSGRVSGAKDYQETDWLGWHPWTQDGQHPFASLAKPERFSHQVRQYDQPQVSIIIPVGPGHEHEFINVLDSLEAQTERHWEAIVVWDSPQPVDPAIKTAYPYIRWAVLPSGKHGAGAARNVGRQLARAPFLLFVDADDWLFPHALAAFLNGWVVDGPAVLYSDYVGKAIVSEVEALAPDLQQRIITRNPKTGDTVIRYRAFDYDCARAQRQPEMPQPYIWCNVTALVPAAWHDEIGGFDEAMPSWEDVDYWYRLAHRGKCFARIPDELLVYRFYTGGRRDRGLEAHQELVAYMRQKYEGVEMSNCRSCGKKGTAAVSNRPAGPVYPAEMLSKSNLVPQRQEVLAQMADKDFVECRYMHPNLGDHRVYGNHPFPERLPLQMIRRLHAWFIDYGYRAGGGQESFLVHKFDQQAAPHLFVPVAHTVPHDPSPAPTVPPPPPAISALPVVERAAPVLAQPEPELSPTGAPPSAIPGGAPSTPPPRPVVTADGPLDLQSIPGVTEAIANQMQAAGITTLAALLRETEDSLQRFKGVAGKRAGLIMRGVQDRAKQLTPGR